MPCNSTYCINNTGLVGADDNYITGGTYNGDTYWTGQTSGWTIYFYTGATSYWCLSDTLGGSCYLTGKYPCVSTCPDLSSLYVFSGICLTPTPTPTQNCDVLDFTALFDCEYIPTPTPTPTSSVTPTPTITPSSTNYCSIIGIDASGYTYTPTPTPTPSITPTNNPLPFYSPLIPRNCSLYGFMEYTPITGQLIYPGTLKWQDCFNSSLYYYTNNVTGIFPGTLFEDFVIYGANVDGQSKCISYLGMDYDHGNQNTIQITSGPWGYSNLNECENCLVITTPTPTPTNTVTPTVTPTNTPTNTPGMSPTPTAKIMYYVYLQCGTKNEILNNVVIQPVPAIPTNVVGNVIFDSKNSICWELIDISDNLSQLQNIYQYNTYYNNNYFTEVYGTIFSNSKGKTACGECNKYTKELEAISIPNCDFNIRNWSNCVDSNTQGEIYVNDVTVYSFNQSFDSNLYTSNLTVNNGDYIRIHLIVPMDSSITLNTELTSGVETRTITNEDFTLNLIVNCSEKTQKIDIFSTCNQIVPSIILSSSSYNENALISTTYYSSVNCLQTNVSPEMTWTLNGFDTSNVISYEILCEDLDVSGSSPDGYFIHWWVTDISNSQLTIPVSGSWISGNVQPTDYGSGDDANGWNGPCPSSAPDVHDYRIRISALLNNGNTVNSNYSIFRATCISPFC